MASQVYYSKASPGPCFLIYIVYPILISMDQLCPFCNKKINQDDNYCPQCGKKLSKISLPLSTAQRIKIYFSSIVLAPLGLYWFFKYFKNSDPDKKKLAFVALYITIFMVIVLIIVNYFFIKSAKELIETYTYGALNF